MIVEAAPGRAGVHRQRSRRLLPLFAPAALVLFLRWTPAVGGPTICPFGLVTGHACPLCGGTRAAAALLDGRWSEAWQLHPLAFGVIPLMAVGWVAWMGTTNGWWNPWSARTVNRVWAVLGALFLVTWAVRAATGTLPPV